jgi:hypothetical protein
LDSTAFKATLLKYQQADKLITNGLHTQILVTPPFLLQMLTLELNALLATTASKDAQDHAQMLLETVVQLQLQMFMT